MGAGVDVGVGVVVGDGSAGVGGLGDVGDVASIVRDGVRVVISDGGAVAVPGGGLGRGGSVVYCLLFKRTWFSFSGLAPTRVSRRCVLPLFCFIIPCL